MDRVSKVESLQEIIADMADIGDRQKKPAQNLLSKVHRDD